MNASAPALVARSRPLGAAFDLLAAYRPFETAGGAVFFERAGLGLAGSSDIGIGPWAGAGRFSRAAADVAEILSEVDVDVDVEAETQDTDGDGDDRSCPLVAGAFPFDERQPATLRLLTAAAVRRRPGAPRLLEVRSPAEADLFFASDHARARPAAGAPGPVFEEGRLRADPSPGAYLNAVRDVTERIRLGALRKAVLSRTLLLDAGRELDPLALLLRLRAVDPDCYTFAVPTSRGVLVGATPELLVSRSGSEVRAKPLAGSSPRFGDQDADRASGQELLASAKDREEHAIVADAVAGALAPFCERLDRDPEPVLLGTANVWHLSTRFAGRLHDPATSVLELVGALHPTPAVCGTPREVALAAIAELEPFDRGCYAGPLGWVDAQGNGEWAIALRCAELRDAEARLFAGAGIVAGSDAERELDETERKFRALLDALRWG